MIYYLVKAGKPQKTIDVFLNKVAPEAKAFITPLTYEKVFRRKKIRLGTYIFSDLERLNNFELEAAAEIWSALEKYLPNIKLLNHPLKAMRRYQLLRCLYKRGLNDFNVYRLTELRCPEKFPVFIRGENDHAGAETALIHDQEQLKAEIESMISSGKTVESRIIVEFNTEQDTDHYYKKYSAYNIFGKILPRHLIFSNQWHVKHRDVTNENIIKQSKEYMRENPHAEEIMKIFSIANIDYGRIDYSIVEGKLQTYEINTNPKIAGPITAIDHKYGAKIRFIPHFLSAMKLLDSVAGEKDIIRVLFTKNPIEPYGPRNFGKLKLKIIIKALWKKLKLFHKHFMF